MDLLEKTLREGLERNEEEVQLCTAYKNDLQMATRNLTEFQQRLQVDVMVPLGNMALMPGHLYHTNEVLISHANGVYVEATASQALGIVEKRMKVADQRLRDLHTEATLFNDKLNYSGPTPANQEEIVEEYDEEEMNKWRIEHRKRVAEAKKKEKEERDKAMAIEDDSLMEKLDELELMEELQMELNGDDDQEPREASADGMIDFHEKPRLNYALESFCASEETSTAPGPQAEQAVTVDVPEEKPILSKPAKPKAPRKSLQFAGDLEAVKLIHKNERPNTLVTAYDPKLTLQLTFMHSPVEFTSPWPKSEQDDGKIHSPLDIYKHFAHCMKYSATSATPEDQPKSILKKTTHKIPVNRKAELENPEDVNYGAMKGVEESRASIFDQVMGDVGEHKEPPASQSDKKGKSVRVSRFKQSRS